MVLCLFYLNKSHIGTVIGIAITIIGGRCPHIQNLYLPCQIGISVKKPLQNFFRELSFSALISFLILIQPHPVRIIFLCLYKIALQYGMTVRSKFRLIGVIVDAHSPCNTCADGDRSAWKYIRFFCIRKISFNTERHMKTADHRIQFSFLIELTELLWHISFIKKPSKGMTHITCTDHIIGFHRITACKFDPFCSFSVYQYLFYLCSCVKLSPEFFISFYHPQYHLQGAPSGNISVSACHCGIRNHKGVCLIPRRHVIDKCLSDQRMMKPLCQFPDVHFSILFHDFSHICHGHAKLHKFNGIHHVKGLIHRHSHAFCKQNRIHQLVDLILILR